MRRMENRTPSLYCNIGVPLKALFKPFALKPKSFM